MAVLMAVDPAHALVLRVFEVVEAGGEVDEILDALALGGLRALPDFALWSLAEDGLRLITKGAVVGSVMDAEPHSSAHSLWHDSWHPDADRARLWVEPVADAGWLPIRSGVVLAAAVSTHQGADPEGAAGTEPAPPAGRVQPPSVSPRALAPGGEPPVGDGVRSEPSPAPAAPRPAAATNDAQPRDFDHLFGPTQMRPEEDQEPPPDAAAHLPPTKVWQEPAGELSHTLPSPATTPASQLPGSPVNPGDATPLLGSGPPMITAVPWLAGGTPALEPRSSSGAAPTWLVPSAAPAAPATGQQPVPQTQQPVPRAQQPSTSQQPVVAQPRVLVAGIDDRGEVTVNRSMLRPNPVVTVVAARCPQGHLSPAYAGTCRVCRVPIPAQQPFEIPRPTLGQLRLSTGGVVPIDRPVILGRNPRIPNGYRGEQPNLLQVSDPSKDVSGQHLEVSLDYWNVMVRDLGSTNGTEVVLPGAMPFSLRVNDPVIIEPGTRVIMAGSVSFVFEVTE